MYLPPPGSWDALRAPPGCLPGFMAEPGGCLGRAPTCEVPARDGSEAIVAPLAL